MKITPPIAATEYKSLYSWRLNVVEEGRKRLVVFMHDISRYCVVLDGIKAKDWPKLPKIFTERLRDLLLTEQINPDIIDRYLTDAGEIEYHRNNDKQMTAWLNKACETACLGYCNHDSDVEISLFASCLIVGTKNEKDYWEPRERFHVCLSEYGLPLKRCRAFELNIRLQIHNGSVYRTIIVPAEITFGQLAAVIKCVYGWWKRGNQYHFLLYGDSGFPEQYLREERDPSSFDLPAVVMTGIRLSKYLPKHGTFRFLYDYRADWTLLINLTAEHDDYIGAIPRLVSGEGNSPPEDVGGAEGYAKFLDKLKNGKYAQRQEAALWGKRYGYEDFDFEKASREVERSLRW